MVVYLPVCQSSVTRGLLLITYIFIITFRCTVGLKNQPGCPPGTSWNVTADNCDPCPTGLFNDNAYHRDAECRACAVCYDQKEETSICNATHDTGCKCPRKEGIDGKCIMAQVGGATEMPMPTPSASGRPTQGTEASEAYNPTAYIVAITLLGLIAVIPVAGIINVIISVVILKRKECAWSLFRLKLTATAIRASGMNTHEASGEGSPLIEGKGSGAAGERRPDNSKTKSASDTAVPAAPASIAPSVAASMEQLPDQGVEEISGRQDIKPPRTVTAVNHRNCRRTALDADADDSGGTGCDGTGFDGTDEMQEVAADAESKLMVPLKKDTVAVDLPLDEDEGKTRKKK